MLWTNVTQILKNLHRVKNQSNQVVICACKTSNLALNLDICLYDVRVLIGFGFLVLLYDQFISYKLMNLTADITTQVLSRLTFTFVLNHFATLLFSARGK